MLHLIHEGGRRLILAAVKRTVGALTVLCYLVIFGLLTILLPILFGYTPVVVLTGSMEPSIQTGSIIYHYKVKGFDNIVPGDVITYQRAEDAPLVTHRVMRVDGESQSVRTKGDNNEALDAAWVSCEQIVAKMAPYYLPNIGFYLYWAKDPRIIAVVAGIIVLNVLLGCLDRKGEEEATDTKA
jgi:signal peptidase